MLNTVIAQCPCPATNDLFPLVVVVLATWGIWRAAKGISGWLVLRWGKPSGSAFHKLLTFVVFALLGMVLVGGVGLLKAMNPAAEVQLEATAKPRMVFLGAGVCSACQEMEPVRENIRENYADNLTVLYHDVMQNPDRGKQFRISTIPAAIYFAPDGSELLRREGYLSVDDIVADWQRLGYNIQKEDIYEYEKSK